MKSLLALLAALFVTVSVRAEAEFPDVSIADVQKAIAEKKAAIIDVNGSASYKAGHVPTAKDWQAIKTDLAKNLPEDKSTLVIAYCGSPACSAYKAAAKAAKELGYTNVKHMSAGISGWKSANAPLEK